MARAKNLSDDDIARIVELLDGWVGHLSWQSLLDAIEKRLFARYTRQALHRHERIRQAFGLRKQALAGKGLAHRTTSPELTVAFERIGRLEAQVKRLEAEYTRLLEQFVRWAYNASTRNLDEAFLNRALPGVNRDRTKTTS